MLGYMSYLRGLTDQREDKHFRIKANLIFCIALPKRECCGASVLWCTRQIVEDEPFVNGDSNFLQNK